MRVTIFVSVFLLALAFSSFAYEENFDSGAADGWTANTGTWTVENGEYSVAAGDANEYSFLDEGMNNTDWADYTFEVKVKPTAGPYAGVLFNVQEAGEGGGGWTSGKFYYWLIGITADGSVGYSTLWKALGGSEGSVPLEEPSTLILNEWNDVKVEIAGDSIKLYLRGELQKEISQSADYASDPHTYGGIGLAAYTAAVSFDDVKVTGAGGATAVESVGKLATTWGSLKAY